MTHTHAKIRPKVSRFKCYSEDRRTDTTDFIIFLAKIPACIAKGVFTSHDQDLEFANSNVNRSIEYMSRTMRPSSLYL